MLGRCAGQTQPRSEPNSAISPPGTYRMNTVKQRTPNPATSHQQLDFGRSTRNAQPSRAADQGFEPQQLCYHSRHLVTSWVNEPSSSLFAHGSCRCRPGKLFTSRTLPRSASSFNKPDHQHFFNSKLVREHEPSYAGK